MELCCNVIPWCGVKPTAPSFDQKNECPDLEILLTFSFLDIHSSKLSRNQTPNTFIFILGSSLTRPSCCRYCRKFHAVPAWRGGHHWGGGSSRGTPHTPCFCGWVPQGMPHSAAVAVLQVECKWLQLAGMGVDHVIYSAISNNCLFGISVYLQRCNLSGLYQTWNYGLRVWRKLEKEEGMICKISWSYTYNIFSWGQFGYLLFAAWKQQ